MRRLCVVVALAGMVAAGLVGCGGGGGNYSSPKATFETMWAAAKAGNKNGMMACFTQVCAQKIDEVNKLMSGVPKEIAEKAGDMSLDTMEVFISGAKKAKKMEIGAEKITGDDATLEVTVDGDKDTMHFKKEGGNWKLHDPGLATLDIEKAKQGIEMLKAMSKGMKDLIDKGFKGLTP